MASFFYLYLVEDVWSRKILGWDVHDVECSDLAAALVDRIRAEARPDIDLVGWVLHSDNGGPMKGATMLATLQRLGVVPSFSRPSVSDDNPYIESLFRTLKYCPEYPSSGFASVGHARLWVARFVAWYNDEHQHSGIGFVTPACSSRRRRRRDPRRSARNIRASTSSSPRTLVAAHARVEATGNRHPQPGESRQR